MTEGLIITRVASTQLKMEDRSVIIIIWLAFTRMYSNSDPGWPEGRRKCNCTWAVVLARSRF